MTLVGPFSLVDVSASGTSVASFSRRRCISPGRHRWHHCPDVHLPLSSHIGGILFSRLFITSERHSSDHFPFLTSQARATLVGPSPFFRVASFRQHQAARHSLFPCSGPSLPVQYRRYGFSGVEVSFMHGLGFGASSIQQIVKTKKLRAISQIEATGTTSTILRDNDFCLP